MKTFYRLKREIGVKVLEKAGWKCSECGGNKDLCVHHIERMEFDDKRYNDEKYLLVLCKKYHMSYHRKAGHVIPPTPGYQRGNKWGRRGKDNPPVKCKIEGCGRFQYGRSLCKKHYEYYRRRQWVGSE